MPNFLLQIRTRFLDLFSKKLISRFKSSFLILLSRQHKYLIHLGLILIALAFCGFNLIQRSSETVSAKENSLLVDLLIPTTKNEIVKNEAKNLAGQNSYLSFVAIASAASKGSALMPKENNKPLALKEKKSNLDKTVLAKGQGGQAGNSLRPDVKKHTVLEGETISYLAQMFGVDAATILTENNLYADDIIKPGMELTILPVSGTSEKVEKGETLAGIAKKHAADEKEVLKFNKLLVSSDIEPGQILVIPDGWREIKERPRPQPPVTLAAAESNVEQTTETYDTQTTDASYQQETTQVTSTQATPKYNLQPTSNAFSWGWCTWYAAARRPDVTWMGNAGEWLYNAQSQGRATGRIPAVGAILVTNESWWGHVAIVEAVNGDSVTISEMNYQGFGVISSRTISNRNGVIKGYIY